MKTIHESLDTDKAERLASQWRELAERFLSAAWHDPAAASTLQIGPECFPDAETWQVFVLLRACGETGVKPTAEILAAAFIELGAPIEEREIAPLAWQESSAAGLQTYAACLIDFRRRHELYTRLAEYQAACLDGFTAIGELADTILNGVQRWRDDGAHLLEPPKMSRPPAIVVKPKAKSKIRRPRKVRTAWMRFHSPSTPN